ncbi:MAG: M20/M25/M40 family metallo-hydrolase [Bacteroidota bacterium]
MNFKILLPLILLGLTPLSAQEEDKAQLRAIYDMALAEGKAYDWLNYLSNQIGGRLSGSIQAQLAIEYTQKQLKQLGLDRVWLQPVMVPKWVRGTPEFAYLETKPGLTTNVPICALGGSVATPEVGLKAGVVEVQGIEELAALGRDSIAGKIVFYNRPMDPKLINTFRSYSGGVDQRYSGAEEALKYGAVGVIVRSINLRLDDYPHAGAMSYGETPEAARIPAAAISTNAAELLSTTLKLNPDLKFYFKQNCKQFPDVQSYNVIGEIRGSERPEEIILVGGHLDSWDLGDGAHDDGAGVVQSMEVMRLIAAKGYRPKRTLRVVLFMNEENGLRGALKYADVAKQQKKTHVFALESDAGGFTPRGFSFDCSETNYAQITNWASLFEPYFIHLFARGVSGADVAPLKNDQIVLAGLRPDSQRYFDHHHCDNDTFAHVNKRELALGAAAMTALVYLMDKYGPAAP